MDKSTYYQQNRDIILERAKDYYYNNIEAIRKDMRNKYKNLSEEEIEKIKIYQKKKYREKMKNNISEEKREKMREYQKNYRKKKT